MAIAPMPVATACTLAQCVALYSTFFLGAPATILRPEPAKFIGRCMWLTFQTNWMLLCYYSLTVIAGFVSLPNLEIFLVTMFPLAFALAIFLTVAYYALDHFNPEQQLRRGKLKMNGYPWIFLNQHLEHGLGAPFMILFTYLHLPTETVPTYLSIFIVAVYLTLYLVFIHLNWVATGSWPYPFIEEIERDAGSAAREAALLGLVGLFTALGFLDKFCYQQLQ